MSKEKTYKEREYIEVAEWIQSRFVAKLAQNSNLTMKNFLQDSGQIIDELLVSRIENLTKGKILDIIEDITGEQLSIGSINAGGAAAVQYRDEMTEALERSRKLYDEEEQGFDELEAALAASMVASGGVNRDDELEAALVASMTPSSGVMDDIEFAKALSFIGENEGKGIDEKGNGE